MDPSSVVHLPEDVIQEILSKLPTKPILKFKSTSKSWHSLLESPSFIKSHAQYHLQNHDDERERSRLLFSDPTTDGHSNTIYGLSPSSAQQTTPVFDLGPLPETLCHVQGTLLAKPTLSVLGPLTNGLFCIMARGFYRTRPTDDTDNQSARLHGFCNTELCNPATREFKCLAPLTWDAAKYLAITQHFNGFGSVVDHKSNTVVDYKMVAIAQIQTRDSTTCPYDARVYSLRSGSWIGLVHDSRKFEFPRITQGSSFLQPAFMNGSCHWMAQVPIHDEGPDKHAVLQFDIANEVFGLVEGPPHEYSVINGRPSSWRLKCGVFVLDDRLAAVIVAHDMQRPRVSIDVWVMMEYGVGKSWTKIHSCEIETRGNFHRFMGLSFSKTTSKDAYGMSTIERMFFLRDAQLKLVSCGRSSYEEVCAFDLSKACWNTLGLSSYVKTLEPVAVQH